MGSIFNIPRASFPNEGKFYELSVPSGRATEAGMLIDYMGWGNTEHGDDFTHAMSDDQIKAATEVWAECGGDPDYSYRHEDHGHYTLFEFWPSDDARIMVDAVTSYLAATTKTTDIHFTLGKGMPSLPRGALSGRKIFFYDSPDDGARKLGGVWHRLDGWWVCMR